MLGRAKSRLVTTLGRAYIHITSIDPYTNKASVARSMYMICRPISPSPVLCCMCTEEGNMSSWPDCYYPFLIVCT